MILSATHFASINHITALPILNLILRATYLYVLLQTVPFTLQVASPRVVRRLITLVFGSLSPPMNFLNRSTGGHRSDIFNNRDDLIHACTFHACFKVIALAPSRVCFSITTTYYPRVLSCICVFLVTAMHA